MSTLTVRNLEPEVVERLKVRARANHRSLEAEVRVILSEAAPISRAEAIAALKTFGKRLGKRRWFAEDSTAVIRAARDGRRD
ncbi:MAG: Arc family DNA-binding protein [Proteobacteria bacterium]|nr:Arc family DNA-binding protein [Pseudomonadota bacterium]MBI3498048.1 Arc family DNA-binding protein [Pseudomonadota bacterium]